MRRLLLAALLVPLLAFGQRPTTSNAPVVHDAINNWLPAESNGHPPNLPAGTTVDGAGIRTSTGPSIFDPDDDGKVNVLDQGAGIPLTDADGTLIGPITDNSANWNTAYSDRNKWDGGNAGLNPTTGRASLELGDAATKNVGTTTGTVATGDDSRFTNARTPTAHAATHGSGGTDPVTLAMSQITDLITTLSGKASTSHTHAQSEVTNLVSDLAGKETAGAAATSQAFAIQRANHTGTQSADTITDGTTNKAYTATEKTKLSGIASGATANSSDATLLARANHTGTQPLSTISDAGNAASKNVGTSAGTVAAGDHAHSGVYQPAGTYYAPGGTDVAVADGGTGASDAETALTNLGAIPSTALDTDGTLAANSDAKIPSQKAVKTYSDRKGVIGFAATDDDFAHYVGPDAAPSGIIATVAGITGIYAVVFTTNQPDVYYRVVVTLGGVGFVRVPQAEKTVGGFTFYTAGQDGVDANVANMEITILR